MSRIVGRLSQVEKNFAVFKWTVSNFISQAGPLSIGGQLTGRSRDFSFSGRTWYLRVERDVHFENYRPSLCMCIEDLEKSALPKTVTTTFQLKKRNGSLTERNTIVHAFDYKNPTVRSNLTMSGNDMLFCQSDLLSSKELTITCSLECEANLAEVLPKPTEFQEVSSRYGELFANKKKCDVTIKVEGKEFEAHRIVLMAQSPVFGAMFEHDTSEAQEGTVTVPDCHADSFGDFLRYLYTGSFEGVTPGNARQLYVTADKYDVQELKSFCIAHMSENLTTENMCDVVSLADQYEESELMSSVQRFFNKNLKSILSTTEFEALMRTNTRLAKKLLQKMSDDLHL